MSKLLRDYEPALKYGAKILSSEILSGINDDFSTVRYVDGVNGSDSNGGGSPTDAFASIQAAINASSAYDTIYVRPKYPVQGVNQGQPNVYAETLTIDVTKTGLRIIGTGNLSDPYFGPKIKPASGSTAPVVMVHASSVVLENLCIMNQPTNVAGVFLSWMGTTYNQNPTVDASHLLYVGSCGANIRNCEFREGSATGPSIVIRGGYQSTIENCTFVTIATTGQCIQLGDNISPSRGHKIINCNFLEANGALAPNYIKVGSGSTHDFLIRDCTFQRATQFIDLMDGCTGMIANCFFADVATTATAADSTGKITIPAGLDEVAVIGCYGGNAAIVASSGS